MQTQTTRTASTSKPRVTWAQRQEAKAIGLQLPFPCSRARAGLLIREAREALQAACAG